MNLTTSFSGIPFDHPFVLASGPPTATYDMIARAFDSGWAGAVTKTLIAEPVNNLQNRFSSIKKRSQIIAFKNIELLSEHDPETWFNDIRRLKVHFPEKVVIGSIMGDALSDKHWLYLAQGCQQAGADMLELNFSCPHGYPERGKGSAIGQNEKFSADIVQWIKAETSITIPVIPKLTAAVADISHIGRALSRVGADGLCAINTFPSLMGFDLKTLLPKDSVGGYTTPGGFSGTALKPVALRCVSDLCKSPGIQVMACGGISDGFDATEFLLLGAPVVQVCTEVMLAGYGVVTKMVDQLKEFMAWHNFETINEFLGMGNSTIRPYSELDISFCVKAQIDHQKCNGCKNCYVSCRDGGFQAISAQNHIPVVDPQKCTGCSLCFNICPTGAIKMISWS
jgi:dihydropyrimidine dehydrogenase (NAD+) subunit PreA